MIEITCVFLAITSMASSVSESRRKEIVSIIDGLASGNEVPELLTFQAATVPRFSPNYNWREQNRVEKAFNRLRTSKDEDVWQELLEHIDDERYSLTMTTDGDIHTTKNFTVGRLCKLIAHGRLVSILEGNIEPRDDGLPVVPLRPDLRRSIVEWHKKREGRSLYQLQIEVCEDAITLLSDVRGMSKKAKDKSVIALSLQIHELLERKRPIFREQFLIDRFDTFDDARAKRLWAKWGARGSKPGAPRAAQATEHEAGW